MFTFVFSILFYIVKAVLVGLFGPIYVLKILHSVYLQRKETFDPVDLDNEPSCLSDSTLGNHGTVHLKKRNIAIHYVAKGDSNKPLMLFLHGFPEFWYSWRYQLREFGGDYYAVAIDMTGFGQSSKPDEMKRYNRKELATDIKEVIRELGYDSCILVGHDWGGGLAYEVAYYFPDVVANMIVLNCPYIGQTFKIITPTQLIRSSYIYYFQLPYIPEYFFGRNSCSLLEFMRNGRLACKNKTSFTKEDLLAYRYTFAKSGFTHPLNYYRSFVQPLSLLDGFSKRENIAVPSLIVWGDGDQAFDVELSEVSSKCINECSVKYIEGASHWVQMDYPDEVNQTIRDYLEENFKK